MSARLFKRVRIIPARGVCRTYVVVYCPRDSAAEEALVWRPDRLSCRAPPRPWRCGKSIPCMTRSCDGIDIPRASHRRQLYHPGRCVDGDAALAADQATYMYGRDGQASSESNVPISIPWR